ncbi:hypothetical protein ANO14919_032740 [Xylariales sp. No.14919]|nr:hypothetical protein ANO14919_032740 [Xylariales sp. No.14919]
MIICLLFASWMSRREAGLSLVRNVFVTVLASAQTYIIVCMHGIPLEAQGAFEDTKSGVYFSTWSQ